MRLDDSIDYKRLRRIIEKNGIPQDDYKLYVSLVTEGYMGGVRVPEFALKLVCRLGCELNFSFVKI